jgi:hypothetical protein
MTGHHPVRQDRFAPALFLVLYGLLIAIALCCAPVSAVGYIYLDTGEQPTLVAHSQGDTRYYPGDSFRMTVILMNKGRDTAVQVAPLLSPGAYDPSTALGVTVRPGPGDAPVTLKTLPVMAGDIGSWSEARVTLYGTVHQNASPGIHTLPLDVTYRYVYAIPMVGTDFSTIDLLYRDKAQTLPVTIRVMGEVKPAITSERSENMVPGTQGIFSAEIENAGYATGTEVTLRIVPYDNVTFQMVDDSVYLAKYGPGEMVPLRVRIAVRENTGPGSYPAVLEGEYRDAEGMFRSTTPVLLGITVSRGAVMDVIAPDLTIAPGGEETITVTFVNTGDTPAFDSVARIIGNQVIVPKDDSVWLGTMGPGERKSVQFVISADAAIPDKRYVIESEVKYRDGLGALVLSDPMSFGIDVVPPTGLVAITSNPVIMITIAGILAILAYAAWKIRQKKAGRG